MVIPWQLDLSLRGPVAQELHDSLVQLTGGRINTTDLGSHSSFEPSTVSVGPGYCLAPEAMRSALLILVLGSEGNEYYLNSVSMAELWACCMNAKFDWEDLGAWKQPLLNLLSQGSTMQWLTEPTCLGHLLELLLFLMVWGSA